MSDETREREPLANADIGVNPGVELGESEEQKRRWRLILGANENDGTGTTLNTDDSAMDAALNALYEAPPPKPGSRGSLAKGSPTVARWLGDIRKYFPASVVQVIQKDALDRLNLTQMLTEPELLATVEPDVELVANLVALGAAMPNKTKETARLVVRRVVDELMKKLLQPTRTAVMGSLNRAQRNRRPRHNEIDWNRTIRANLKNYQPEYKTIIPENRIGWGRKRSSLKDIIICVDQSGSMATSTVYASICAAVLASIPAVSTRYIVFDTVVVDLSEKLSDPVEVIFSTTLGGGTDINSALAYCQTLVRRPADTVLVLISDLYEGGNRDEMLRRCATIIASGVTFIPLLALTDKGSPISDTQVAGALSSMGASAFGCTPDLFPDMMAAALNGRDMNAWAASKDLQTSRPI